MSGVLIDDVKKDKTVMNPRQAIWIQHAQRIVYFSPMEGFEKKEFRSQVELMDWRKVPLTYVRRSVTKACISAGYHIG